MSVLDRCEITERVVGQSSLYPVGRRALVGCEKDAEIERARIVGDERRIIEIKDGVVRNRSGDVSLRTSYSNSTLASRWSVANLACYGGFDDDDEEGWNGSRLDFVDVYVR